MRKEYYCKPAWKWDGEFKLAGQLGADVLNVYVYLECGVESHRCGVYRIRPAFIAEMIPADRDAVVVALDELNEVGLIQWDAENSVVWVPSMFWEQYRWKDEESARRDPATKEVYRHIEAMPHTPLIDRFYEKWPFVREVGEAAEKTGDESRQKRSARKFGGDR